MTLVIDASNLRAGRLAAVVAKKALLGEDIIIINSQDAVITGNKDFVVKKYRSQHERGRKTKGPFQPRMPDRFLRRIIRGMLPYKTDRGIRAYRRIKCFIGNPDGLKAVTLEQADISMSSTDRYVTIRQICQLLGGRNEQ